MIANSYRSGRICLSVLTVLALTSSACTPHSAEPAVETTPRPKPPAEVKTAPTATPEGRLVEYQPGIKIDFRVPQVEVAAEVILRDADLELFAYAKAPTPKEHETVLLTRVRPLHVHEALGLIGLTPGNPVSYDYETKKITPATGDPVDVLVQYEQDGRSVEDSACDWMYDVNAKAPMKRTHWLFTGSRQDEKGRFAADIEGTLVTVVNFDTSLLSLPESHSDSDAQLWLKANTAAIPEPGTKVTLILRPARAPASSKE